MKTPFRKLEILAWASLLALLAFLVYWNIDNYQREEVRLKQDLFDQMSLATGVYRDEVLSNLFTILTVDIDGQFGEDTIKVISHDVTHEGNLFVVESMDSIGAFNTGRTSTFGRRLVKSESFLNPIIDSGSHYVDSFWNRSKIHDDSLFIQNNYQVKASNFGEKSVQFEFNLPSDGAWDIADILATNNSTYPKIDSIFKKQLEKENIDISYQISYDSIESVNSEDIIVPFQYEIGFNAQVPDAVFTGTNTYLLKQIKAPLIVSLLLFSGVAFSFFSIIKTWRSHSRLSTLKSDFISNMTHELNTPIATISVALEAMENFGAVNNEQKRNEYLAISKQEVGRLKLLVDRVMNASFEEGKEPVIDKKEFDLNNIIEELLKSLQVQFDKNKMKVTKHLEGESFVIKGDQFHLTNVLYNLVDNAIKYRSEHPNIRIKLNSHSDKVAVAIEDNGIGIPAEYLPQVFNRFFRVPNNDKHNVKGHGLGLNYAKRIVERHGGHIECVSEKGKGTVITLSLPK